MEILLVAGVLVTLGALVFVIVTPTDLTNSPEVRAWNERAAQLRELEDHAARVEVIRAEQVVAFAVGREQLRGLGRAPEPRAIEGQRRAVTPR